MLVYFFVQFPHSGASVRVDVLGIDAVCYVMSYEWIRNNENKRVRFSNTG